ncbi:MAG TPA: SDR family oxidoreductase [Spirochaetota bacterium]|nr:SDR family oxidoreductase [Spirochaetota bacterium]HOD15531.1 SDR family oxidoreductase [Spirochaetota bacterium]HPG51503.1 SDR family oxidoreductase [Spirochaetota bacterium]HPN11971.1 SDR family oxidoreductase [Spirochaetota bacterium]HQL83380.1 SDR family oxidoreductase [Spirochaetota bacterium]
MNYFQGKNIYITGGSSGIGLEIARRLAAEGAHLLLFARTASKLEEARRDIETRWSGSGQKLAAMPLDVSDDPAVRRVMDRAVREFGPPDILITSAGIGSADYFENITYEAFDAVMKINLYGTRNMIAALLEPLKARRGHVAIISSVAGYLGMFGYTAYGTSKFALVGFADCIRGELKRHGVRLTLACPPETDTPFLVEESKTIPPQSRALKDIAGRLSPEVVAARVIRGIRKNSYLVIPGFRARALYLTQCYSPGWLSRLISDMTVARVDRKLRKGGHLN